MYFGVYLFYTVIEIHGNIVVLLHIPINNVTQSISYFQLCSVYSQNQYHKPVRGDD